MLESPPRRLVLASGSPRRRALAAAFVPMPELIAPSSQETPPRAGESPERYVLRLSLEKAHGTAAGVRDALVLGADTAIVLNGEVFGKPESPSQAARMLRRLRGKAHRVVTGVTAVDSESGASLGATRSTDVTMRRYSDEELEAYVATGDPMDKAGAYAVQDVSFRPAEPVQDCYLNVVGLPLCDVVGLLAKLGADARLRPDWRPPDECLDCPLRATSEVHR